MSNTFNDLLLAEAHEILPETVGTPLFDVLTADIANNDLEALYEHLSVAREMVHETL